MGNACCVAPKSQTITNGSTSEVLQRNRYSPSWSFRWENRGRVAGEDMSMNWFSDGISGNQRLEIKSTTTSEAACASEEVGPLDGFPSPAWQKSPFSDGSTGNSRFPVSGPSIARSSIEVKESIDSPAVSSQSPTKLSTSAPSVSSFSESPRSSRIHLVPANSTALRRNCHSPRYQLSRQVSGNRTAGFRSPTLSISEEASCFLLRGSSIESIRGSNSGGSSNSWSTPNFPEPISTSRRERWSFDSEIWGFSSDRTTRCSGQVPCSPPLDIQTCGICTKLLTEKSSWGSQRIIANELSVVSVLICGHVYHAECLENMTAEINKYDPACPVCTFGEKQALKMSQKALKAERDPKARKMSKNRVVDSDYHSDLVFDRQSSGHEGKGPKMSSSSIMKSPSVRPFLRRHFSFGSNRSRSLSHSVSARTRGFFWARSKKD